MGKRSRDNSHKGERELLKDVEEDLDEVNETLEELQEIGRAQLVVLTKILAALKPAQAQTLASIRILFTVT